MEDSRRALLEEALAAVRRWEERWGEAPEHPATMVDPAAMSDALGRLAERMEGNFPFFHPRFAGQMLKPPHPAAVTGYLAAMLVNPNNHALDGGPVTSGMEREVVGRLAAMVGLPGEALGHLTSGGTMANLEALWVARELHPGTTVLHSAEAHYTHGRMCQVLGVAAEAVPTDARGRLDLQAAEDRIRAGGVGTLVVTAGTTGLGAVDDVAGALELRRRHGVRIHVDAAYGGYFTLIGELLEPATAASLAAISGADSVVIDPHKHGLQPYGCGAVLFADPGVGRLYRHDSPYTYFTSDELHLGEISLECSRAGAAAAALWLTTEVLPLETDRGLGPVLAAGRRATLAWAGLIEDGGPLRLHLRPELDILTYLPWRAGADAAAVSAASERMLAAGMAGDDPVWLSTLRVGPDATAARHPDLGRHPLTVLRSVLMKPEHEAWVDRLHARVGALADVAW